ncbi:hypothetical protein T440DRAFT_480648 [Plenodomus tracheiphilus IPT5]|uniref:Uncharacterized protein n=1 Tax=Plenodomus tracheiphilus IPT5 TaxID=1408161 RepID=A0A6A7AZZ4_9PLEO|nr:hypothetical protein T440DRAFT_480648 [Plenodomus tracheiphilus IPT5]
MQFPTTLLFSAILASTASASALNFLTWNCTNCQDNATCSQTNYQNVYPGPVPNNCMALRSPFPLGLKVFSKESCPAGQVSLYAQPGCTDAPLTYTLESRFPSPGNPTCHNETALATRAYFRIFC